MRMHRRFAVLAMTTLVTLMNPPRVLAQKIAFEVASVRPAAQPPGGRRCTGTSTTDAGHVERRCISLVDLLHRVIGIPEYKLVAPDWISQSDQKFDISAKLPEGATQDQIPEMFQSLLEDRFGLAFHRESRERPILALVVAKVKSSWERSDVPAETVGTGGGVAGSEAA